VSPERSNFKREETMKRILIIAAAVAVSVLAAASSASARLGMAPLARRTTR
jgi:hypothetical protein